MRRDPAPDSGPASPATTSMTISVVIPNLHSPLIDRVVQALEQQSRADVIREIIIVGQDRYGRVPRSERVRFVQTPRPIPPAQARNTGAYLAQGDYVHFLDADCVAQPDMVARLLERYQQGEAVVGGGMLLRGDNYWAYCDNLLLFAPFLTTTPGGPRIYLASHNLSIRRTLFLASGGFNERFKLAAGEDYDLSLRLRQQGYTLFCEPRAAVEHCHQRTTAATVWRHVRMFGHEHVKFWGLYPDMLPSSPDVRRVRPLVGLILALSPLLALRDVLRLYQQTPGICGYLHLLPGMVWGRIGWYWGIVDSVMIQREDTLQTNA